MKTAASVRFAVVTGAEDATLLNATERERCARLRQPDDRAAFVAAHVLLRECVASLLGLPPQGVTISQRCARCAGPHGRPTVIGHPGLYASLSHARTHVAAVAAWSPCGVDVEQARPMRPRPETLTPDEHGWLAQQADPTAGLRLWVRKEALVKAGVGTLDTLDAVDTLAYAGHLTDWSDPAAVGASAVLN